MVVVCDAEDRENEGDLTLAAQFATPENINFMAREGRGLICLALTAERCDELGLDLMAAKNESAFETAFTVSVEAREGVTTGISAHDRAHTIQVAIDPRSQPERPRPAGSRVPAQGAPGRRARAHRADRGGRRPRAARGPDPGAVICEIMNDDGTMARVKDLIPYCERHGLKMITVADLIKYRRRTEKLVERVAEAALPTEYGEFDVVGYRSLLDNKHHVALVKGDVRGGRRARRVGDGARALGVPDRRRLPLASLRLRAAARRRARADRGRGARRAALPVAGGPRHRAAEQAARLQASGGRARHRRREHRARACPPTCATTASARRSWSTSGCARSGSSRTTRRRSSGWRATASTVTDQIPIEQVPGEHNRDYLRAKRDKLGHTLHHQGLPLDEDMFRAEREADRREGGRVAARRGPGRAVGPRGPESSR